MKYLILAVVSLALFACGGGENKKENKKNEVLIHVGAEPSRLNPLTAEMATTEIADNIFQKLITFDFKTYEIKPWLAKERAKITKNSDGSIDIAWEIREEAVWGDGTPITGYDVETSFWNITDQRIDSMESGLPNDVLDVIRYDFFNTKESNWDILSDEERNRQLLWFENEYQMKKVSNDYNGPVGEVEVPMNEAIPIRNIRRRLTPLRRVTIDAEAELTRLLEEEIMEESVRDMSEYSDDDYIDQAG